MLQRKNMSLSDEVEVKSSVEEACWRRLLRVLPQIKFAKM